MAINLELERAPVIKRGDLTIDPQCCTVMLAERTVDLYPKEYDVLLLLAYHVGWVLTPGQIYRAVWQQEEFCCEHIIYNIICQIRKKLKCPHMIQTVKNHGYRFVA